jgi:Sulfotransferase family
MTPDVATAEQQLHAAATQMSGGLTDFGPQDYLPGLRVLLDSMLRDMQFSEIGRQFGMGSIAGTLAARLHTQNSWKQRPDYRKVEIRRPLVITGIPRTGTTALHKLLSMDPQFQGLEHWLTEAPQPRPPREAWAAHPAFQASVAGLDTFFRIMPEMRLAHDIVADEVDECLEVLRQDFVSNRFASGMHVPSYERWFRAQDEAPSYRRFVDVLRLVGVDAPGQRWLLKNPGHVAQMDCLLAVLPDACVIQTHRDPVRAIPSLCSTLHMARRMFEGDAARADVIGAREVDYWSEAMAATARVRAARGHQFHDVHHRDFHREPMAVVRGIYERFDLTLSDETARRMQGWIDASPTTRHGEHRYRIEDYGITVDQVRARFADYVERHSIH